jgi:hypothetical protein
MEGRRGGWVVRMRVVYPAISPRAIVIALSSFGPCRFEKPQVEAE